ncbi:hypothetical protein ACFLX1_00830 [Chloroflexota bacterium]
MLVKSYHMEESCDQHNGFLFGAGIAFATGILQGLLKRKVLRNVAAAVVSVKRGFTHSG